MWVFRGHHVQKISTTNISFKLQIDHSTHMHHIHYHYGDAMQRVTSITVEHVQRSITVSYDMAFGW